MRRLTLPVIVALGAAALSLPGTAALGQQLAYRVPSPATATYVMVDSTSGAMSLPGGTEGVAGSSSFTYELSFEPQGAGMRVAAELTAFSGQAGEPMGSRVAVPRSRAGVGNLVLILEGDGLARVVSGRRGNYRTLPLFVEPYEAMFPRLPSGDVQAGDSWADTVTVGEAGSFERIVAYTYTLVGETTLEGRRHLRIDVSGDTRVTITENGMPTVLTGSDTGYFLWDIERGLPAFWEVSRSYEGTVDLPDGSFPVTFSSTTWLVLAN